MKIPSIPLGQITSKQLRRAARIKDQIAALEKKVITLLSPEPLNGNGHTNGHVVRRKMSLAARRKISLAQKAAWASRRK